MVKLYYYFKWNKRKSNYLLTIQWNGTVEPPLMNTSCMQTLVYHPSDIKMLHLRPLSGHLSLANTFSDLKAHRPLMAVGSTVSQNHFFPKF